MARIIPDMPQRGAAKNLLSVVDNYYAPARDRMGEAAMAKGFGDVSNLLGGMAQQGRKEELTEIGLKAEQDAMAGDDPDVELSKVRMGGLFRANSKAYNQAYNETMGKKAAIDFQNSAALDYEKSGMKNSTDPNRFREWMNTRVDGFLKAPESQNPYFLAGAMGYIQQATINMSAAHTSNISSQLERNHIAAIQTQADDVSLKVAKGELSIKDAIDQMAGLNNQGYATGLDGPKVRKALISSFLSVADATDNNEMIDALLAAQSSGTLRLTPDEWNSVVKQGEGIERDITFRKAQKTRAVKAQTDSEVAFLEDNVADFFNNPANAAVSFSQFLQVEDEDGKTMAQYINESPNTAELLKKGKAAYETVNSIYDISELQAQNNNLAITDAIDSGTIKTPQDFIKWRQAAQTDGLRLNGDNVKHAFAELEKLNDPEQSYGTQTYKDYKRTTENRLINAMTPKGNDLLNIFSDGTYQGTMADDIRTRFQTNLDEHLAAIPPNKRIDPKLIKAAIADAENDVMEFYKQYDPDLYQKQFKSFTDAVNEGEISWTANPNFAENSQRLAREAQTDADAEKILFEQNRAYSEAKLLALAEANALLFPEDNAQTTIETPLDPAVQVIEAEIAQAAELQAKRDADKAIEAERIEAEKQAVIAADEALMTEAGQALTQLNDLVVDNVKDEQFVVILEDIQERFNLTKPTSYAELKFFTEDLIAMQKETGIEISIPVAQKLIAAAMRKFK